MARVVDGDTIECPPLGRVRLIGIDSPELGQAPFGAMARDALSRAIPVGTEVLLEPDVEERDVYHRVLGYVWSNGKLVNWRIVREGYALLATYPPNVQYVEWIRRAENAARAERVGLWSVDGFSCPPRAFRDGSCR